MECNKEEAMRAKEIAEKRVTAGDFSGAQRIAHKARRLFPALDDVTQLLTVCEVHCSAQNKILGTEMDWYTILQIEQSADEMTIKKQYRKLALLLHPDKNKFSGAEAAFKLIGEANRVLSDKAKRSVYDLKFRATAKSFAPKSQAQPSQANIIRKQQTAESDIHNGPHSQYGAANNVPKPPYKQFAGVHTSQSADKTMFWTCCCHCNIRYQYHRTHVNKVLRCQSCHQSFAAYDLGSRGMPPGNPWSHFPNQNGIPNPGSSTVPSQSNPSKLASENNRGKPSATPQEKVCNPSKVASQSNRGKPSATPQDRVCKASKVASQSNGGKHSAMPQERVCNPSKLASQSNHGKPSATPQERVCKASKVASQSNGGKPSAMSQERVCIPSKVASQSNRGKPSATPQERVCNPSKVASQSNRGKSAMIQEKVSNPYKVASQTNRQKPSATTQEKVSNASKVASQTNRGKPSAMTQEKVDVNMNVKEGVRMHKPIVANGKEGVGKAKLDRGKPSEYGTSRSSEKKRKREPLF